MIFRTMSVQRQNIPDKISDAINRVDAFDKCTGKTKYINDFKFDGMLYAKTLRSTRPRAKIKSIHIPELPDGYYIVDKNDVPGRNRVKILIYDQPFFAEDVVNYIGEPILLVVGPHREKILHILSQIEVNYEDLEPVLTMDDALSADSPRIFGRDNCFVDYKYYKGNPEKAFANAQKIIQRTYRTGYQEHIYIEPQGVIGLFEDGKIKVYGSIQCPYYVKRALAEGLDFDEDKIRVIQVATGGAFGGKEEYPSIIAGQVAFASIKTKRPVKLILDRKEDIIATTKRHPSITHYRTALDENNNIIAMDVDIKFNAGAYAGLSDVVLQRGMFSAAGVYNVPNIIVRGRAVCTNNVPAGAFRGFGAPQVFFAVESHFDEIAEEIGENPLDFRMRHIIKKGERTSTGGILRQEVKLPQMVERVNELSHIRNKWKRYSEQKGSIRRGIGISMFYHGCGFTGKGEEIIQGKATLRKYPDGKVEILVSNVEMGQGALTALRKIVARTLQIPIQDVIYENPDTDRVPDSGPTVASRTVMIVGGLLKKCAEEMKSRWNQQDKMEISRVYKHPDYIQWDQEAMCGDAYPTYSWGINVVEIKVDTITYEITPEKVWAIFDVGIPIDEKMLRGQFDGGIVQGLGYAYMEIMQSSNGKLIQDSITDYIIPTANDVPEIVSETIDNPYEYGPFGAKCAGELPFVGAAPALASAVRNALHTEISQIPITPEMLMKICEKNK